MAQSINTNVASLTAQRNLNSSAGSLSTSLQRLSSGLRINSAKDDSAGLAISSRMTSQINGLNQAARNANDGISLAQTAEGALNSVSESLQRMRELSVQSSNATNSASDRASIQKEVDQLVKQIDTVANQTSFNGTKLLDGSFTAQTFQVGANKGETINIEQIASAKADSLGVGNSSSYAASTTATAVTAGALTAGGIVINGVEVGATASDGVSSTGGDASAIAKANAINAVSGQTGVTAKVSATSVVGAAPTVGAIAGTAADSISINGVNIGAVAAGTGANTAVGQGNNVAAAINAVSSQTGVTATANSTTGVVSLTAQDGRNIEITDGTTAGGAAKGGFGTGSTTYGKVALSSTSSAGINVSGGEVGLAGITAGVTAATASAGAGVSAIDVTTSAGAQNALATIDAALQTVNASRADLGAIQNRFSNVVSNLATSSENISAARGRITDTDFAAETANLSRSQILQQAGTAMLAQANALPQNVLSLLR